MESHATLESTPSLGNRPRAHRYPAQAEPPARRLGRQAAYRLLWRGGFGPRLGELDQVAELGRAEAVHRLTRPIGAPELIGPPPRSNDGSPLAELDSPASHRLGWMDRMVSSDQPLVERLTVIFYDWLSAPAEAEPVVARRLTERTARLRHWVLGGFPNLVALLGVRPGAVELDPVRLVSRLWSNFIPVPIDRTTATRLAALYDHSGYSIRAVVESILLDDRLYAGPPMVKPPIVYCAGMLRGLGGGIDTEEWLGLDATTLAGRWRAAGLALRPTALDPSCAPTDLGTEESPAAALSAVLRSLGDPPLSQRTFVNLRTGAAYLNDYVRHKQSMPTARALRFNSLRRVILTSPDYQVC